MAWYDELLPASWRGVPFGVTTAGIRPGRQTALHDYPFRDTPWVEDIGRAPRPFRISGFLVDGDVFSLGLGVFLQRDLMVIACETSGPGLLVHPSLGARTVSLIGGCEMTESRDAGGAIELAFEFIETVAGPAYPVTATDTTTGVANASGTLDMAASGDFAASVLTPVQTGAAAVQSAVTTVAGFALQAAAVVNVASVVVHAATGLPGITGRYAGGNRSVVQPIGTTLSSLLAGATAARTAVSSAGALASQAAALL